MEIIVVFITSILLTKVTLFFIDGQRNWNIIIGPTLACSDDDTEVLKELGSPTHKMGCLWFFKEMPLRIIELTGGAFYVPSIDKICISKNTIGQKLLGLPLIGKSIVAHEMGHMFFRHSNMKNWVIANINEILADTFSILYCRNFNIIRTLYPILKKAKTINPSCYKLHLFRIQYMKLLVLLFNIDVK